MKMISIFTIALALACAPMIHAQQLEPELQAQFDRATADENQPMETSTEDLAPSQAPQAISMAMTTHSTTTAANSNTQKRDVSRGRYGAPQGHAPMSVFKGRRPYSGPECLQHLGHKTARELGWAGRRVYNEMLHGAEIVPLSGNAMIYYDTASMQPIYLEGCYRNGKPYKNMIAFVEEEPPPQRRAHHVPRSQPCLECEHHNIVKIHDCYGNVTLVQMNDAEFAVWLQTQGRSYRIPGLAGGQSYGRGGSMARGNGYGGGNYGNGYGGGNPFISAFAQIGRIDFNFGDDQRRPPQPQHRRQPRSGPWRSHG